MEQLVRDGYQSVPGVFSGGCLAVLRDAAEALFSARYEEAVLADPQGRIARINAVLAYAGAELLKLVGGEEIETLFAETGFQEPVPVLESLVAKRPGDGQHFLWHQDFIHGRAAPALVFGIYLDHAVPFEGAVQFVPGSHTRRQDMHAIKKGAESGSLRVESPAMAPGDVLIHDVMVAHASASVPPEEGGRRVFYLEVHDARTVLDSGMGTPEDVAVKRQIFSICRQAAAEGWTGIPDAAREALRSAAFHRFRNPSAANYAA